MPIYLPPAPPSLTPLSVSSWSLPACPHLLLSPPSLTRFFLSHPVLSQHANVSTSLPLNSFVPLSLCHSTQSWAARNLHTSLPPSPFSHPSPQSHPISTSMSTSLFPLYHRFQPACPHLPPPDTHTHYSHHFPLISPISASIATYLPDFLPFSHSSLSHADINQNIQKLSLLSFLFLSVSPCPDLSQHANICPSHHPSQSCLDLGQHTHIPPPSFAYLSLPDSSRPQISCPDLAFFSRHSPPFSIDLSLHTHISPSSPASSIPLSASLWSQPTWTHRLFLLSLSPVSPRAQPACPPPSLLLSYLSPCLTPSSASILTSFPPSFSHPSPPVSPRAQSACPRPPPGGGSC